MTVKSLKPARAACTILTFSLCVYLEGCVRYWLLYHVLNGEGWRLTLMRYAVVSEQDFLNTLSDFTKGEVSAQGKEVPEGLCLVQIVLEPKFALSLIRPPGPHHRPSALRPVSLPSEGKHHHSTAAPSFGSLPVAHLQWKETTTTAQQPPLLTCPPLLTYHVQQHNDTEVDAHCGPCGCNLRVIPDQRPLKGCESANSHHPVNDNPKHSSDHHADLEGR